MLGVRIDSLVGCREAAVHEAFYQNNVASEARQRADK
jgi:hypothetical protein